MLENLLRLTILVHQPELSGLGGSHISGGGFWGGLRGGASGGGGGFWGGPSGGLLEGASGRASGGGFWRGLLLEEASFNMTGH